MSRSPVEPVRPHVVIIGGGFAGLATARGLARSSARVTLVDRRNFHLFQPLLYQVATGGLSPAEISAPLRGILSRQPNVSVRLDEVQSVDLERRAVILRDSTLTYDLLVVAAGATHHYFGHDEWRQHAPGLKTIEDATRVRARLLDAFERAERSDDPVEQETALTFVLVGAGPTGVELAGALGELAHWTLRRDFRRIDPSRARILLVDGAPRVLPALSEASSAAAAHSLERLGVEIWLDSLVTAIGPDEVTIRRPDGERTVAAGTVLWASGVAPSPLAASLLEGAGLEPGPGGRVPVEPDLTLPGHPEVLVLGDLAAAADAAGKPLPGVAPVAMQQGRYAGRLLSRRLRGQSTPPFRYRDKGQLAVIGRAAAVAEIGRARFSGYPAWVLWLLIHILYLAGFTNRLLVLIEWGYSYLTRRRGARLITRSAEDSPPEEP